MPQSLRKLEQHLSPGALPLFWSLSCHLLLVGGTFLWPVSCSCPMTCPCPVLCPRPSCQCCWPSCLCSWLGCSSPALVLSPPQVALAVGVELSVRLTFQFYFPSLIFWWEALKGEHSPERNCLTPLELTEGRRRRRRREGTKRSSLIATIISLPTPVQLLETKQC